MKVDIRYRNNTPLNKIHRYCSERNGVIYTVVRCIVNVLRRTQFVTRSVVKIDPEDCWNLDYTLALIIYPALQQYIKQPHGASFVDIKDVPKRLRPTTPDNDDTVHERWVWVIEQMASSFEQILKDENFLYDNADIHRGLKLFGKYYTGLWS